jgi:hypothetical protein
MAELISSCLFPSKLQAGSQWAQWAWAIFLQALMRAMKLLARCPHCGAIHKVRKASFNWAWATFLHALMQTMKLLARSLNCGIFHGRFEADSNWALFRGVELSVHKTAFLKAVFAHALMAKHSGLFPRKLQAGSQWAWAAFLHALMRAMELMAR